MSRPDRDAIHVSAEGTPARPPQGVPAAIVRFMKLPLALVLLVAAAPLAAETVVVNDQVELRTATVEMPTRGSDMSSVEKRFGAPQVRHPAVGQPPITRWDYPGFSVYFEYQHVVHSVATGG
jgi:hypothetical protein